MEVPLRCQLNTLSWKDAKLLKLLLNCYKPLNCSKFPNLGLFLLVYGVGPVFWVWTGSLPALTQKMDQHQITIHHHLQPSLKLTTSSVCASRVFQIERAMYSSLVCLCHGSVYCATSMPDELEVYQHASRCPQMSWRPWRWATVPDGSYSSSFTKTVLMVSVYLFVMMIFDSFTLSCDGLLAVFVTINCFKSMYSLFYIVLLDWVS